MRVAFLLCVERGPLEEQAKLLCRSLRQHGGRYATAPIYSFQPRRGTELSPGTLAVLAECGVVHSTELLNNGFHDYPIGNKMLICAHAEAVLSEDILVFLDTDTVFLGEPTAVALPEEIDVALRPAASVLTTVGDPVARERYWGQLRAFLSIEQDAEVETELGSRTRAYFSSGFIIARRRSGVFSRWKADFLRLVAAERFPGWPGLPPAAMGLQRMDEISLVATLLRDFSRVQVLDGRYNYLIYRRPSLSPPWNTAPLEEIVHVHYRFWFNVPGFMRRVRPALDTQCPLLGWLEQHLPLLPVVDRPLPPEHGT